MSTLDTLIQKLAGANSTGSAAEAVVEETIDVSGSMTDPVFVEKLASAVDFIVDNFADQQEESQAITEEAPNEEAHEEAHEEVQNVSDISDLLKSRLQTRLTEKVTEKEDAQNSLKSQVAQNVLGKLLELKSSKVEEETTDKEVSDDTPLEEVFESAPYAKESEEISNEVPEEVEVKAASVAEHQSLADVLNAALSSDEQVQESVQAEDTKTAGVRGGNGSTARKQGVEVLKEKLLATVGKEAQS